MQSYTVDCPFCFDLAQVNETTTEPRRRVGLVYLRMKCLSCMIIVEAVGNGEAEARNDMTKRLKSRMGTDPNRWHIKPVAVRKRIKKR